MRAAHRIGWIQSLTEYGICVAIKQSDRMGMGACVCVCCVCAVVVLAPRGVNAPSHGHSGKAVARVAALVARVL